MSRGTPQSPLRHIMPSAGMKYLSHQRLMHSLQHEESVTHALEAVGCQLSTAAVSLAFAQMFAIASPFVSSAHAQSLSLWDTLPWVQRELNWAELVSPATFFELFVCLIEARHEGLKGLDPSVGKVSGQDVLVDEIDAFRRDVGDYPEGRAGDGHSSWIVTYAASYYQLVGGPGADMSGYEDAEMEGVDDIQGGDGDEYIPYVEPLDGEVAGVISSMQRMGIQSGWNGR